MPDEGAGSDAGAPAPTSGAPDTGFEAAEKQKGIVRVCFVEYVCLGNHLVMSVRCEQSRHRTLCVLNRCCPALASTDPFAACAAVHETGQASASVITIWENWSCISETGR